MHPRSPFRRHCRRHFVSCKEWLVSCLEGYRRLDDTYLVVIVYFSTVPFLWIGPLFREHPKKEDGQSCVLGHPRHHRGGGPPRQGNENLNHDRYQGHGGGSQTNHKKSFSSRYFISCVGQNGGVTPCPRNPRDPRLLAYVALMLIVVASTHHGQDVAAGFFSGGCWSRRISSFLIMI